MSLTALQNFINKNGRFPTVGLTVITLPRPPQVSQTIRLSNFVSYSFDSNIVVPVDTFSVTFAYPSTNDPLPNSIRPGDIAILTANDIQVSTGIIDSTEIEVTDRGEMVTINGRNLLSQLEDQNCVSVYSNPIYGEQASLSTVMSQLLASTRIQKFDSQNGPSGLHLFATEPGESKLDALLRYLMAPNSLVWMTPDGTIRIGKPAMDSDPVGTLIMSKTQNYSNVLSMKAVDSSAMIPNLILPIFSGQEVAQTFLASQAVANAASGPNRLLKSGHLVPKVVVTSIPDGASPQDLAVNERNKALRNNLLGGMAERELCRENFKELQVQCVVPGHYNDDANPFLIDQVYNINFDRASINEKMYLYQVQYGLSEDGGQKTVLSFCRLGTIVGGVGT